MEAEDIKEAEDWEYLSEGNLNITCNYVGSETSLKAYVLRIKKNTHSEAFNFNCGVTETRYRELFFQALKQFPTLVSFFPEIVITQYLP
jgi:hypothetical protein